MVAPTEDMALVRAVFTHDAVWPYIHDDGGPTQADYAPMEHPSITYLAVRQDEKVCGCLMLYPINHVLYELHSAMLPEARGAGSQETARQMLAWLWANTPAVFLMTWVPAYNVPAAVAARKAGFTERNRLPGAYLKNGAYHDLIFYGVAKCPQ